MDLLSHLRHLDSEFISLSKDTTGQKDPEIEPLTRQFKLLIVNSTHFLS